MNTEKSKKNVQKAENIFREAIYTEMHNLADLILGKNDEKGFIINFDKPIAISSTKTSDDGEVTIKTEIVSEVYRLYGKWNYSTTCGKEDKNWGLNEIDLGSVLALYNELERTIKNY